MDRARPDKTERLNVTAYGADARAVERVASVMPGMSPHQAALRAIRAGLPLVEQELRDQLAQAAARLVAPVPPEAPHTPDTRTRDHEGL